MILLWYKQVFPQRLSIRIFVIKRQVHSRNNKPTLRHFSAHRRLSITSLPHIQAGPGCGVMLLLTAGTIYISHENANVFTKSAFDAAPVTASGGTNVNQTFGRRPIKRVALTPHNEAPNWNKSSLDGRYKFPSLSQRAWKRAVPSDEKQCRVSKGTLISCAKLKSTDVLRQERQAPVRAAQPRAAANHWWGGNTQFGDGKNKHSLCFQLMTLENKKVNKQQEKQRNILIIYSAPIKHLTCWCQCFRFIFLFYIL